MKYLIDVAYILGLLAYSPKILYRMIRQDRYKTGWSQRLGKIRRRHPQKRNPFHRCLLCRMQVQMPPL